MFYIRKEDILARLPRQHRILYPHLRLRGTNHTGKIPRVGLNSQERLILLEKPPSRQVMGRAGEARPGGQHRTHGQEHEKPY